MVSELLKNTPCSLLLATSDYLAENAVPRLGELLEVTEDELRKASFLKTPQQVLGVFEIPAHEKESVDWDKSLVLMLDGIQDPGNLGTIVRLADWYGIEHIVCSPDTADVYNPKVVQATMGALARVKLHYTDLAECLSEHPDVPVYGTFLDGENIYGQTLSANGAIVMGNEGKGIRPEVARLINRRLFVPSFPPERESSESLNVAVATAVVCAEFRRRLLVKV